MILAVGGEIATEAPWIEWLGCVAGDGDGSR